MFDYEKYINELIKIKEEEMDNYPENVDDFDEYEKPFIEKRSILNKNNKIIFKHDLKDAWQQPEDEFYILDSDKDNIVIIKHGKKYNYSISREDLESIKKLLSNSILYKNCDVVFPPVLDGTSHEIYISSGDAFREFECSNLWYWLEEEVNNDNNSIATDEDVEYTRELVNVFRKVQKILTDNNIVHNILDIEDDEEDE